MPVWEFTRRWASVADNDLRAALATCLLEHLLEHHFQLLFPLVERAAREDRSVARLVALCWTFGESAQPENAAALERLKRDCGAPAI